MNPQIISVNNLTKQYQQTQVSGISNISFSIKQGDIVAIIGENGAGKSTLYEQVLKPKVQAPFINADLIQKTELSD